MMRVQVYANKGPFNFHKGDTDFSLLNNDKV